MEETNNPMILGLGEAIQRAIRLHNRQVRGAASQEERDEFTLLMDALNHITIDLNFACDIDLTEDQGSEQGRFKTIDIFEKTAKTSCCRMVSHSDDAQEATRKKRSRSSSRS